MAPLATWRRSKLATPSIRGDLHLRRGQLDEALDCFERADSRTRRADALGGIAIVRARKGDLAGAREARAGSNTAPGGDYLVYLRSRAAALALEPGR